MSITLAVIAKAPEAGRSKTRLCPPCTPAQAAALADAALQDTLETVRRIAADRHVLVLDGAVGEWLPSGFEVLAQRGDGLAARLAAAFDDLGGPALLIGMDTPQLQLDDLAPGIRALQGGAASVLGPALDGGYWAIGLAAPDPAVFEAVPMSVPHTCKAQRARLVSLGHRTVELSPLRDVDDFDDALAVAAAAPRSRFARGLRALTSREPAA